MLWSQRNTKLAYLVPYRPLPLVHNMTDRLVNDMPPETIAHNHQFLRVRVVEIPRIHSSVRLPAPHDAQIHLKGEGRIVCNSSTVLGVISRWPLSRDVNYDVVSLCLSERRQ